MNIYSKYLLITSGCLVAFSVLFGVLVLLKSAKKKLGWVWFLFSLSVAAWGVGGVLISLERSPQSALAIWRFSYAFGVNLIAPLFFHFVSIFIDDENKNSLLLNYIITVVFCLCTPFAIFFSGTRLAFGSIYWVTPGWMGLLFCLWWHSLVVWSHVKLVQGYKRADPAKRNQIKYFFLATAVGFGGGLTEFFPMWGINWYPWGSLLVTVYPFIMGYAMLKYQLMDVRIFIRRAILLVVVYVFLLLLSVPILFFINNRIQSNPADSFGSLMLGAFAVSLIVSIGPIVYAYFIRHSYWLRGYSTQGLAHELKGPLGSIQGAVELLLGEMGQSKTNKKRALEYVEIIQRNSERISGNVTNLLQLAKAKESDDHVERNPIDLQRVVKTVIDQYRSQAQAKKIKLVFSGEPVTILANEMQLSQVVSNILSNAIKFSSHGTIRVILEKNGGPVTCSVQDQGRGLSKKDLKKIFDRFYQVDSGVSGSGIGLTIAKAWVEAHGGKIWAESEGMGKGTRVTFTVVG